MEQQQQQQTTTDRAKKKFIGSARLGKYLRKKREDRNLSLEDVEDMTEQYPEPVTKSHLSRIENGRAIPTFPRMFALSQTYGIPISSMAEKFEMELTLEMIPASAREKSDQELIQQCKGLQVSGRYIEALLIYDELIQRHKHYPVPQVGVRLDLKLGQITCLVHLARYSAAKGECEDLLSEQGLSQIQKAKTLQFLSMCCYRLGKFTIALITLDCAENEVKSLEEPGDLLAHLATLKGNLMALTGQLQEAAEAYRTAIREYERLDVPFESCRSRLNLASTLIELGKYKTARTQLEKILAEAESQRYDRQHALALSNLGLIAFREGALESARRYCTRSNLVARPREFISVIFRNCYYLREIAQALGDVQSQKSNEKTLRTYLSRVEENLPEAQKYRAQKVGGES